MVYGVMGKILRLNLSNESYAVEEPGEKFYRTYGGGGSLACYYLLQERPAGIDPLDPQNLLVFSTGPLVGTNIPGDSRFTIASISPLTGSYGESQAGGWWGPELKRAGYDAILVEGRANRPVYIWISDKEVQFRDANHLWGRTTGEAQDLIRQEVGYARARVALIGQAGENMVRYASVVNNLRHTCGRTGMGAVMGSKNLKAIAVKGTNAIPLKDPETLKNLTKWYAKNFRNHTIGRVLTEGGTIGWDVTLFDEAGILPTRNFRSGSFVHADKICGETFHKTYFVKADACHACPVRCKRVARSDGPYQVESMYGGPEYETAASFGSLCEVSNLEAICKAHELCNKYTMDSISTGATIAFAMECFENGLLSGEDTDGLELRFGNDQAMIQMIEKIAKRQGIGDLLAEGTRRAAQKIGQGSEKFAMQVKGLECAMHQPVGKGTQVLSFSVSPIGATHLEGPHDWTFEEDFSVPDLGELGVLEPVPRVYLGPEKVRQFAYGQMSWNLLNTIGLCCFTVGPGKLFKMSQIVDALEAATGWNTSLWEVMKLGERTVNLRRAVSVREGLSRKDDCLPDRFFEPLEGGILKGKAVDHNEFEKAVDLYYDMMGWDRQTGIPTRGKLVELNLGWVNQKLGQE